MCSILTEWLILPTDPSPVHFSASRSDRVTEVGLQRLTDKFASAAAAVMSKLIEELVLRQRDRDVHAR